MINQWERRKILDFFLLFFETFEKVSVVGEGKNHGIQIDLNNFRTSMRDFEVKEDYKIKWV